jgi:hypothetical protein
MVKAATTIMELASNTTGRTSSPEGMLTQMLDDGRTPVVEWDDGEAQTIRGKGETPMESDARRRGMGHCAEMVTTPMACGDAIGIAS